MKIVHHDYIRSKTLKERCQTNGRENLMNLLKILRNDYLAMKKDERKQSRKGCSYEHVIIQLKNQYRQICLNQHVISVTISLVPLHQII